MFNSKLKARVAELEERSSQQYLTNLELRKDISHLRRMLLAKEIVEAPAPTMAAKPKKPAPKKPVKK